MQNRIGRETISNDYASEDQFLHDIKGFSDRVARFGSTSREKHLLDLLKVEGRGVVVLLRNFREIPSMQLSAHELQGLQRA